MGLLSWVLVDFAINWGGWAVSTLLKTEKFYDMLGSTSFLVLSVGSLFASTGAFGGPVPPLRKYAATAMVAAWAVRLGAFLVARVMQTGRDSRFDQAKNEPGTFFVYWTMQAVWVFTTLLPVLMLNCITTGGPRALVWTDVLGGALYLVGLGIEATADAQKSAWRADPANKGKFIDTGLWGLSRYPNYFGEMMVWWGVLATAAGGLTWPQRAAGLLSPLCVMMLLRFVSGVPIQERQARARWGESEEYVAYVARTNLLVPLPKWGGCGGKPGHD